MFNFKVPAAALECARQCADSSEIRQYLRGVRVSKTRISASNGKVLYDYQIGAPGIAQLSEVNEAVLPEGDVLLVLKKAVPVAASWAVLQQVASGIVIIHYGRGHVEIIDRHVVELLGADVAAGFPDVDKLFAKMKLEQVKAVERIGFNAGLLVMVEKIAKRITRRYEAVQLVFHGPEQAAHFEFNDMDHGKHMVVVMPMRV